MEHSTLETTYHDHDNPYHFKLAEFDQFVFRDHEAEAFKGKYVADVFKNQYPLHVEVGSGYGDFMFNFLEQNPEVNFIGIDYKFKRSYQLARKMSQSKNQNFKYLRTQAEKLNLIFDESEIDTFYYFFPDPWPKQRHHKKRLFQTPLLETLHKILKPGGKVWIKTDHDDYFVWMLKFLNLNSHLFKITFQSTDLKVEHPDHFLSSFETKFEKMFLKKNIKIKALVLESIKA